MSELRIQIDIDGRLDWMFCDLERLKSIQDLKEQIEDKYRFGDVDGVDGFFLLKDGARLPKREDIRLLSNGDTVRICISDGYEDFDLENY